MTLTAPARLTNGQLAEIGGRLRSSLTDEGLRAWYKQDVNALVREVLELRAQHARAVDIFRNNPPLHDVPADAEIDTLAQQLADVWIQQEAGLWKTAENRRLRDRANAAQEALQARDRQIQVLQGQVEALRAENAQIERLQATVAEGRDRLQAAQDQIVDLGGQISRLQDDMATLTRHRDHLQKVANAQLTEIRKRDNATEAARAALAKAADPARLQAIEAAGQDADHLTTSYLSQLKQVQEQIANLTRQRDHWQGVASRQQTRIQTLVELTDTTRRLLANAAEQARNQANAALTDDEAASHQEQLKALAYQVDLLTRHRDHLQIVANTQQTRIEEQRQQTLKARALLEGKTVAELEAERPAVTSVELAEQQKAALSHQEQIRTLTEQIAAVTAHRDRLWAIARQQDVQISELRKLPEQIGAQFEAVASQDTMATPDQIEADKRAAYHQEQLAALHADMRTLVQHRDHLQTVANAQLTELRAYQAAASTAQSLLEGKN